MLRKKYLDDTINNTEFMHYAENQYNIRHSNAEREVVNHAGAIVGTSDGSIRRPRCTWLS